MLKNPSLIGGRRRHPPLGDVCLHRPIIPSSHGEAPRMEKKFQTSCVGVAKCQRRRPQSLMQLISAGWHVLAKRRSPGEAFEHTTARTSGIGRACLCPGVREASGPDGELGDHISSRSGDVTWSFISGLHLLNIETSAYGRSHKRRDR